MKIPYVIDNQTHPLADVLKSLLAEHAGRSVDSATAYFSIHGFRLLYERGGSGWLDRIWSFLSGASRVTDYAAVSRVVRLGPYT